MHFQYCVEHQDYHIPCDCCGDGWHEGSSPCGAYANRSEWQKDISWLEAIRANTEFPEEFPDPGNRPEIKKGEVYRGLNLGEVLNKSKST